MATWNLHILLWVLGMPNSGDTKVKDFIAHKGEGTAQISARMYQALPLGYRYFSLNRFQPKPHFQEAFSDHLVKYHTFLCQPHSVPLLHIILLIATAIF